MKYTKISLILGMLLLCQFRESAAQQKKENIKKTNAFMGFGIGMDFGGIGCKVEFVPVPYVGIFAGLGFNFQQIGFNGGLSFKALPHKRLTPTLQTMYGYNAVIMIAGAAKYNKTYYGPSVGVGLDWKVGKNNNKLFAGIYHPFRSQAYHDDLARVKADPGIEMKSEPGAVTASIGFNFAF
ncbi:MAG TPA: hypothetical protein VL098_06470 [Flavipsychrobacter sp.]|nr:hypothetical protein [Flavipsychrobacter sp.]